MTLVDKMSLWGKKSGYEPPELDLADLFTGVKDDTGTISHHLELSTYSKTIISSTAYKWFVDSLLKESELHWDDHLLRTMVTDIRKIILDKLPKSFISRQHAPTSRTLAQFRLSLSSLQVQAERHNVKSHIGSSLRIADVVVLTGSSPNQVQAATVREYLNQVWARGGNETIYAIEGAINSMNSGPRCGMCCSSYSMSIKLLNTLTTRLS